MEKLTLESLKGFKPTQHFTFTNSFGGQTSQIADESTSSDVSNIGDSSQSNDSSVRDDSSQFNDHDA